MTDQKQLENVEYFKCLCCVINDAELPLQKQQSTRRIIFLGQKTVINFRKKLVKCYIWSIKVYGAENWTLRKSKSQMPEKFRNVMLGNDVEEHFD
jgi:hypothetical protein